MKSSWTIPIVCCAVFVVIVCLICLCLVLGATTYFTVRQVSQAGSPAPFSSNPTSTPVVIRPTPQTTKPLVTQGVEPATGVNQIATPQPSSNSSQIDTLQVLSNSEVPVNDLVDLAERLEGKKNIVLTQAAPTVPFKVGDKQTFWVSNTDTNDNFQVEATLRYITGHAYFWIQDDVTYNANDLKKLAETFENKIYPTDRAFFGSEWTPGVDSDPHIYILYVRGMGGSVAGYFSSVDEYPPAVHEYSNWHEMFLFNADNVSFREDFTYGVLAHEFQHMIHWYRDRNEDTWMNEGFSDLAMLLNGYDSGGHDYVYTRDPDVQLNDWPTDHNATVPHYGAAFLFMTYFLDRFGEDATKALVARPENGLESIDLLLKDNGTRDPMTGKGITADDVFLDWVLTSYIQNKGVGDGRYFYHDYPNAPQPTFTENVSSCTPEMRTRDVHQYGVDYIDISCNGAPTLHFEGSTQVGVVPINPYSGSYAFWSNKGDESDMILTRSFDFTQVSGDLNLSYWTWYDLEKDFDYVYLEASTDGKNWNILNTPSGTAEDPSGNSFGWGYNGLSGTSSENVNDARWIQETVDLSQYAGKKVQLRFEYVTDAAVNGDGFLLDDVSIPQINYFGDFESDAGGWEGAGFVRIQNALPQTYRLALIGEGPKTTVQYINLADDNTVDIPLDFENGVRDFVLVVTGTTRYTRQTTGYRFDFTP
jgi:immune inhibitor A